VTVALEGRARADTARRRFDPRAGGGP
jgi:hypothetical protein